MVRSSAAMLDEARQIAEAVVDPELPFLTVHDLGILRELKIENDVVVASVSPTYSGCPALVVIEKSVADALTDAGFNTRVERVMSPPWTTDWITDEGRKKLLENGIAPPQSVPAMQPVMFAQSQVCCPRCSSANTEKVSEFGSTPCKAQYRCLQCLEPFDSFKCH